MIRTPHRVLQHVVSDGKCVLEMLGVFHHESSDLIGLKEPLVRVQTYGIGACNTVHAVLTLWRHQRKSTVCGINVKPHSFFDTEFAYRL